MRRPAWVGLAAGIVAIVGCSSGSTSNAKSGGTTTTGFGISTTTIPNFTGSANSKYCTVARQISQIAVANISVDPKTVIQKFDPLAGPYLDSAPAVIHPDVAVFIGAIQQLETAVKAANYDVTKVNPTALGPIQDPKFAAAVGRINAYDVQVCGLTTTST